MSNTAREEAELKNVLGAKNTRAGRALRGLDWYGVNSVVHGFTNTFIVRLNSTRLRLTVEGLMVMVLTWAVRRFCSSLLKKSMS